MVFSSIIFLLYFLPIFLLLYFIAGRLDGSTRSRNLLTLGFSILFYAWGAPIMAYVVIITTLADYIWCKSCTKTSDRVTAKYYWPSP